MKKKLTLNETWKWQLRLSGYVAEQKRAGDSRSVDDLKREWLAKNWEGEKIQDNCFFCDYSRKHPKKTWKPEYNDWPGCPPCPATLVDKNFDCYNGAYHFAYRSIAFYNKLVSLNRKRQKALAKRRQKCAIGLRAVRVSLNEEHQVDGSNNIL